MIAQVQATGYDWLATGGSYWIIGTVWFVSALFFALTGLRAGKVSGNESNGCLLAICCVLLALTGGGVGLYAGLAWVPYPLFVITSMVGAIVFPAIGSAALGAKMKRRK